MNKSVYLCQKVYSDESQNEITLFETKEKCMLFINEEIDKLCEKYGLTHDDVQVGLDSWHIETEDGETTFYFEKKEIQ